MDTKEIIIKDREHIEDSELLEAARILREGGLVAFPRRQCMDLGEMPWTKRPLRKFMRPRDAPRTIP